MRQDTLSRRLDLLKLEGNGLLRPEIVEELSTKYGCSKDAVWYDFRTRAKWQPKIEEMEKALLRIINRHDQLYRKAVFQYSQVWDSDRKTSILVLNLLRNLNRDAFDIMQSTGKIEKVPEKVQAEIKAAIIVKMWKPEDEEVNR